MDFLAVKKDAMYMFEFVDRCIEDVEGKTCSSSGE
jgi:hypothetical protein